jgi:putative thiamine transport system ATP-binding protein
MSAAAGSLKLQEVGLALAGRPLFAPLTLEVPPGSVATVMGPSGSGKSSLLAFVCGTLDPKFEAGGRVLMNGSEITALPPERRRVGILFQDDLLFPHLSVAENLAFGLPAAVTGRQARRQRIEALRMQCRRTHALEVLAGGDVGLEGVLYGLVCIPF